VMFQCLLAVLWLIFFHTHILPPDSSNSAPSHLGTSASRSAWMRRTQPQTLGGHRWGQSWIPSKLWGPRWFQSWILSNSSANVNDTYATHATNIALTTLEWRVGSVLYLSIVPNPWLTLCLHKQRTVCSGSTSTWKFGLKKVTSRGFVSLDCRRKPRYNKLGTEVE